MLGYGSGSLRAKLLQGPRIEFPQMFTMVENVMMARKTRYVVQESTGDDLPDATTIAAAMNIAETH
jgi:hypothetical protein